MRSFLATLALAGACLVASVISTPVAAQPGPDGCHYGNSGKVVCAGAGQRIGNHPTASYSARRHVAGDPRPRAWCGWQMRQWFGVADRAGNRARWWVHYGAAAAGPAVGVIVVWPRGRRGGHVGVITGRTHDGRWIVKSGNDGHRVRERPRSVRGAIAFRRPVQRWASR